MSPNITKLQEQLIDKLRVKMNLDFDFEIVPVQTESFSVEKQCYSNVAEKVKRDGGQIHYGWSIHFTDGIIVEAERHAVWENDEEDLLCITQNPSKHTKIIFFSDNTPVDPKLQIDNVRMNITNNILVSDWIYLCDTIGLIFYKYTDRINDFEVNVEKPVHQLITEIEQWRGYVMGLIQKGKKENSKCFCEDGYYSGKKYLQCHGKSFRKLIPVLLKSIEKFAKR